MDNDVKKWSDLETGRFLLRRKSDEESIGEVVTRIVAPGSDTGRRCWALHCIELAQEEQDSAPVAIGGAA